MSQAVPLSVLEDRIRALEADIGRMTVERDVLRSLRNQAITIGVAPHLMLERKKTLTDTVREYVIAHPGLTGPEVTTAIEGLGITIGGSDPRKTISTTLGALVQKQKLRRDDSGRHFAP